MNRTTPRPFQQIAINSGLQVFAECKRLLDAAGEDAASRAVSIGQHGTLLIEAPTGAGKTLIAGHLAESFSAAESIVWFWFAPFKGVTGQSASVLRAELPGLRLRELSEDRQLTDSRTGDVFVTTWQTVATRVKDCRNVHKPGETNLTLEELVAGLRANRLRIGTIVDEAHHGFFSGSSAETQAMRLFRETLRPEYTVLITATPDDSDIARFQKGLGISQLNRITIGRREPVEEGLIKEGIKCAAYFAAEGQEKLVDFEDMAMRDAVALHRRIKTELGGIGVDLAPLLLVQVDSKDRSVERARDRLIELGFSENQIATHTADEPDSGLLALANDETREVLIFKMAVALGFDAPRAAILVSMRAARDEDFGVQLVGRILRIHRRLQARARAGSLPPILKNGYVFLADAETQTGLDLAGQRINRLQTEYAKVSPTTAIIQVGNQVQVQVLGPGGQTHLLQMTPPPTFGGPGTAAAKGAADTGAVDGFTLKLISGGYSLKDLFPNLTEPPIRPGETCAISASSQGYSYPLRSDVPHRFKTHIVSANNDATEDECAQRFVVSSEEILRALIAKVKVERRTLEVFTHQIEMEFKSAALDPDQAARIALRVLTKNETFDARELRRALMRKLRRTLQELAMDQADDDEKVGHMLNVILCRHPELLFMAQKAALAANCEVEETEEELPSTLSSTTPLPASRFNVYGVYPSDLNSWELPFAQFLDSDSQNIVRWWHRNLPHKPWSVHVTIDGGGGFFPDFIIGLDGRKREFGALLADPKYFFEIAKELPKTYAEHPIYGRIVILNRQGSGQWFTVRYDAQKQKAVLAGEFRLVDSVSF